VALSNLDRELLRDCLEGNEEAWKGFCDRFIGLIVHTVHHVATSFRIRLDDSKRDDLVSEVFVTLLDKDFAALRRFRGESSLGSYLVVIARRTVTKRVLQWKLRGSDGSIDDLKHEPMARDGMEELHAIDWNEPNAFRGLSDDEASAIRLFHLEGKSYREISSHLGMEENSIGPFLSRARKKLRRIP
jgi:RNA polymerase sigma-70 factor, ECF subfamily